MSANRRPHPVGFLAILTVFAEAIVQPLSAETDGAEAEEVPTDNRIERLREKIEREGEALERELETRRSMEEELGRMRDELERTREELEELERETDPGVGN